YHGIPHFRFRNCVIFVLHILAFFEFPSSLSWTSDIRHMEERISVPCGVTEGIEVICLLLLLADIILMFWLMGRAEFMKKKWLIAALVVLSLSLIDWAISMGFQCTETNRVRRILRPFFIIVHSSLMKKTVKSLQRTLPEVVSVLLLLALHLYVFTLVGMLLFPQPQGGHRKHTGNNTVDLTASNQNSSSNANQTDVHTTGNAYFTTLSDSFMSLLVLLTTANNPDGNFCFMNMFLAVIYNQFRGYFQNSLQASLLRRRVGVRAAYEVLRDHSTYARIATTQIREGVPKSDVMTVVEHANIPKYIKTALKRDLDQRHDNYNHLTLAEFQKCFELMDTEVKFRSKPEVRWFMNRHLRRLQFMISHRYYNYFGNVVAIANVIVISVELTTEYDRTLNDSTSSLNIVNFAFIIYYLVEQILKFTALGWKRYVYEKGNIYDGIITIILVVMEIISISIYGLPLSRHPRGDESITLWNVVRLINILIMFRLLRIIPSIKAMSVVANTLIDLVRNLKSFAGILIVIYYSFAILGIELFHDKIKYYDQGNSTTPDVLRYECGSYQQLEYWANNFNDFAAAIVVLWDVMVVNNWSIFLKEYAVVASEWSYLYFVAWWLLSVVIVLQLFTALIIENFIMKWDKSIHHTSEPTTRRSSEFEESGHFMTVHDMFRDSLAEPSEEQIMLQITNHRYLNLQQTPPLTPH
ncbi:hypothetical protein FSP39_022251, partial [Pinctada imbricata]